MDIQAGAGHETEPAHPGDGSLHVVRRLRRAFLSICRCGDVMFSPYRLTTEQYSLMRAVQREPGVRQVDVKDRIFAEPNTVTAMVTLLERRGILRRKPSPVDGRARLLYLTTHGQAVLTRLSEDWDPMRAVIRKCFAGQAGQDALEILDTIYSEMERERECLMKKACMALPAAPAPSQQTQKAQLSQSSLLTRKTSPRSGTARAAAPLATRKRLVPSANSKPKSRRP